jgi:hypothetical protein
MWRRNCVRTHFREPVHRGAEILCTMHRHSRNGGQHLLWISRRNQCVDLKNIPRPETRDVIVAGKRGEQSISSRQHIIKNRAARGRAAIRKLVDQRPCKAEFVVMRRLNSRPGAHRQRRRQAGSPDERRSAADKNVRGANCQAGSAGAHRNIRHATSGAGSRSNGAGNDRQRA